MAFQRIINLLGTMQTRVDRVDKYIEHLDDWSDFPKLKASLARLKDRIATYESRPSILKTDAIDRMRQDIQSVRSFAADPFLDRRMIYSGVDRTTLRQALERDCDALSNIAAGIQIGLGQLTAEDVAQLIPRQKIAAYQFAFEVDRIIVIDQPAWASDHETALAEAARELLLEQGERILADLRSSNCPPRLIETFAQVQTRLAWNRNIVQIGMEAQTCTQLLASSSEELSSTLFGLVKAHLAGVATYLAQFPDWRLFTENAAKADIDRESVSELVATARILARHFEINSDQASPSVPAALNNVADHAEHMENPDGRSILALGRTLENIWSIIVAQLVEVKNEIVKEGRKAIAKAVLGLIVGSCAGFVVVIAKLPGAEWIESTLSYFMSVGLVGG